MCLGDSVFISGQLIEVVIDFFNLFNSLPCRIVCFGKLLEGIHSAS